MSDDVNPSTSDSAAAFESPDTAHALPWGWLLLLFGLVAWGAFYLWAYTPSLGGWSQASEYEQSLEKR